MTIAKRAAATLAAGMLATGLGLATAGQANASSTSTSGTTAVVNHDGWGRHHHHRCHWYDWRHCHPRY